MELLPISALQHLLFCERQCALIHVEQLWAENQFTAEGNVMHEKAHDGPDETKAGVRIVRGLYVKSEALGLSGQCDVVEVRVAESEKGGRAAASEISDFKSQTGGRVAASEISDIRSQTPEEGSQISDYKSQMPKALPIEYKRGKPKAHRADEVQLCAQALCLEETLSLPVPEGRLFYGQTRRRMDVVFDAELRELTVQAARRLHEMIDNRETPLAVYEARKCDACSLKELCMPGALRFQRGAAAWFDRQISNLGSEISAASRKGA